MANSLNTLVPRAITPVVVDAMAGARVVALLGPRQAGKSTLAKLVCTEALPADFLSLDDATTRATALDDPDGFVARLGRRTVIDEVQRAPDLLLAIKSRVDHNNDRGQFLLTGSANLRRLPRVADALPGRVDYLTLWPLAQAELAGHGQRLLPALLAGDPPAITDAAPGIDPIIDRIVRGGFPEAQYRSPDQRRRFFRSYVEAIVARDLSDAGSLRRPDVVADLLRLIASRSGSLAPFDRLGAELGLDGKTAKSYVETLERLFLIRIRRAWTKNLGKRQVRSPKLYVADTGLLAELVGADEARLSADRGLAGALLETFVTLELERQESWAPDPLTLWHFREREDEVDVVAESASGAVVGVEVKAAATVRTADLRGLTRLRDQLGPQFRCGCVLYTGTRTLPFGDRLWAVPISALWAGA